MNPSRYHGVVFDAGRRVKTELDFLLLQGTISSRSTPGTISSDRSRRRQFWAFSGRVNTVDAGPLTTQRAFDSAFWMAGLDLSGRRQRTGMRAFAAGGYERSSQ